MGLTLQDMIRNLQQERDKLSPAAKIEQIAQHHRIQNSPGIDQAIQEMMAELKKAGVSCKIESFESNDQTAYQDYVTPGGWSAKEGQLTLKATGEVLADYTVNPIQILQRSISTNGKETLEVYVVDDLEQVLAEQPDLSGKILLTSENVHKVKDLIHDPLGARGIIFDGMRSVEGRDPEEMAQARQYTSFWWYGDEEKTFGFVITPAMGRRLREEIQTGKQVEVECQVVAEFIYQPMSLLHAEIPGQTDEKLLMVAHICHPYTSVNDNASGAGVAVEVMQLISRLLEEKKIPQLIRGIDLILVPEFSGTFAYLDRYLTEKNYLAGINLDMVGEDQEKCGSTLCAVSTPLSSKGLTGDFLYHLYEEMLDESKVSIDKIPFMAGSDHAILTDPAVGIPSSMIIQQPDRYYHTDQDTLDKLDPELVKDITLITTAYLTYFGTAQLAEVRTVMEVYQQAFVQRVQARLDEVYEKFNQGVEMSRPLWYYCTQLVDLMAGYYAQTVGYFNRLIGTDEEAQYHQFVAEWAHQLETNLVQLKNTMMEKVEEMITAAGEKLDIQSDLENQPIITPVEKELGNLIPKRKFWGFTQLRQKRHLVQKLELSRLWEVMDQDQTSGLALYWVNGERNLLEIMDLVELETGLRQPEILRDYFRVLEEIGSIEFC